MPSLTRNITFAIFASSDRRSSVAQEFSTRCRFSRPSTVSGVSLDQAQWRTPFGISVHVSDVYAPAAATLPPAVFGT